MRRDIIYGGEERPHFESDFEFYLKFILRFVHKTVEAVSFAVQRIFPTGVDGKKIIKE